MRILFIGGTGNISLACTYAALEKGYEVFHLNRGSQPGLAPAGVTTLTADIRDPSQTAKALKGLHFDSVVDWVAYLPQHIEQDIETFAAITDQFVFISSASAYKKPPDYRVVAESTPLDNPYWQYSRDKIACEKILLKAYRQKDFPCTIVRPSHTYCERWLPTSFGSRDYTVPNRILQDREIIVHGDGQSIWTLTHSRDFARGFTGILGNPRALGEAFHITSDEALTWDNIHRLLAQGLGVEPRIVHIPSDFIYRVCPERGASLLGDKAYSTVFDNAKIKRFVPEFQAEIPFHEGLKMSLDWFDRHPQAKISDAQTEADIERILKAWKKKRD
jgi:nucleoside-diphosphate-sugar epimerase